MTTDRMTRVNELLRREIAGSLFRLLASDPDMDVSAITITRVVASPSLRQARVFVSIRDHEADRKKMLHRISRHRGELQEGINLNLKMKYTPRLIFQLDPSLEQGDRILGILAEIEAEHPEDRS